MAIVQLSQPRLMGTMEELNTTALRSIFRNGDTAESKTFGSNHW